jgi:Piwi domain
MLIGIDVTHKPRKSIAGIVATYNDSLMQYNSQYLIQEKGQELIDDLYPALSKIFIAYEMKNGCFPEHIIIYRDGVGEQMRELVLDREIPSLSKIISDLYNKLSAPKLTVCVVNKRINQRFTHERNGKLENPPPGTVVDKLLV